MVTQTLDFMRDASTRKRCSAWTSWRCSKACRPIIRTPESTVEIEGSVAQPYPGRPLALRRCLTNLVDNAIRYGGSATIKVEDARSGSPIRVLDEGPGIPEAGTGTGVRALLPGRGFAQPRDRRHRPGPGHRAQHRARARRRPGAEQPRGRRAGGDPHAAAPRGGVTARQRRPFLSARASRRTAGRWWPSAAPARRAPATSVCR